MSNHYQKFDNEESDVVVQDEFGVKNHQEVVTEIVNIGYELPKNMTQNGGETVANGDSYQGNGKANGTTQLTNVMDSKEDCEDAIVDISLDDDSNPNQVISRAADFFLENNDNYRLTWDEASHRISENEQDPSKPPVPGINLQYVNWRLRRMSFDSYVYFVLFASTRRKKQLETATRQFISQNKRRYQQDGYDLDLTYVTARVIATSFPSSGMWAWYRNPIEKVASFLDKKHHGKYKLYNLCSEKTYDVSFFHSRVERFMIDDHNVPSLSEMLRFAENVREWFDSDPDNVIVVHCKGGKGRTGTMICVWLVESGVFTSADQSLDYFGSRRTDTNVSKKFQGVETPSQSRYVRYFELMKTTMGGRIPEPRPLLLKEFTISGMSYVGAGDGSDFWFSVDQGRGNRVFSANMSFNRNCVSDYDSGKDILKIQILNSPILDGDIRVVFQTSSKIVPKGYEECPFYFWFNTAFINIDTGLFLSREELDNPHKPKTWSTFRDNFSVQAEFALP
ncbi:TPTE [Lepeophtheirus salmonis]|uniref:TPTE n=1 Tax=Lepeophtheirus salmonis TaxID=72036 RepID=A0A7R8CHW8_LEPSM|nr:TPTE [Lepeophtheirus salmonis]CAF2772607.1 TPTE [Lepeophtheirus salmonis]